MDRDNANEWIPALAAIGGLVLALIAFWLAGFLAVAFVGVVMAFAAIQLDLSKEDVGGGSASPHLYARQLAVRADMRGDERISYQAGLRALWRPLTVAKTIGFGLILLGFCGFFFLT